MTVATKPPTKASTARPLESLVHTFYTALLLLMFDFDTNDFEYQQALVAEDYMAEFMEDLAAEEEA